MNGYYELKVIASTSTSASASANACDSDRGRTTTNMTSSIVEVGAYELRVLFSISSVGVIVDNKSMAVSCAS